MYLAALNERNRINEGAARLHITNEFIAKLVRIRPAALSVFLRGIKPLDREKVDEILALIQQLEALVKAFDIVPLSLENPDVVDRLLERIRKNDVTNEMIAAKVLELFGE